MPQPIKRPGAPRRREPVKSLEQLEARIGRRCDALGKVLGEVRDEVHHIGVTLEPLVDHVAFLERELLDRVNRGPRPSRRRPRR